MPEPVLVSEGFTFEHRGARYFVPEFTLRTGEVIGIEFSADATTDGAGAADEAGGGSLAPDRLASDSFADDSLVDDLGESLIGLAPLAAGALRLFGRELVGGDPEDRMDLRRRVALAPLRPAFLATVTLPSNVGLPLDDRAGLPEAQLQALVTQKLAALSVPIVGRVLPGDVTPRTRYLAGLARALLAAPELLVVCVPETGLPRPLRSQIAKELEDARDHGVAVLVVGRADRLPVHVNAWVRVETARAAHAARTAGATP